MVGRSPISSVEVIQSQFFLGCVCRRVSCTEPFWLEGDLSSIERHDSLDQRHDLVVVEAVLNDVDADCCELKFHAIHEVGLPHRSDDLTVVPAEPDLISPITTESDMSMRGVAERDERDCVVEELDSANMRG